MRAFLKYYIYIYINRKNIEKWHEFFILCKTCENVRPAVVNFTGALHIYGNWDEILISKNFLLKTQNMRNPLIYWNCHCLLNKPLVKTHMSKVETYIILRSTSSNSYTLLSFDLNFRVYTLCDNDIRMTYTLWYNAWHRQLAVL